MHNVRLNEAQAGIKIVRRNINNLRYADDTILMAESEEELKNLLMRVKEELKMLAWNSDCGIWSHHFMANKKGKSADFIFLGSKITADCDCSHEIKRCFLLGRKAITNLERVLRRDITLPTKVHIVKAMVFPVVMYGCESWTIKKAEHGRINAFKLWSGEDSRESLGQQRDQTSPKGNPKGNQPWIFIGRTFAEANALENPMDRGAWQATVHRVTKGWTWLKQLSTHNTLILWWPVSKSWLTGKYLGRLKAKGEGVGEDEIVK